MRLFIAIEFTFKFKEEITSLIQPLADAFPQVSWIRKENLHLTLKFLGETQRFIKDEDGLLKIKNSIRNSCEHTKVIDLTFVKLGFFTKEQLIIWLGAQAGKELPSFVHQLDKNMENLGFPKEKRIYYPHITLGRGKHLPSNITSKIKDAIRKQSLVTISPFQVKEVTLMQSTLSKKGPIYTPLAHFSLLFN